MKRTDSGFMDSYLSKIPHEELSPVYTLRSNTASTRHRTPKKTPEDLLSVQPTDTEPQRPTSKKRPSLSQKKSTVSSSENSTTRSKGRGYGSKPSSGRTSCTIVDPSRPARHYRIQSSQTVPAATNQDIDDVLALHFRSCSLFTNPSYQSHSGLPSPALSHGDATAFPTAASRLSSDVICVAEESMLPEQSQDAAADVEKTNTTMHWTSPSTRKRDYKRIDKANTGLRGLVRRAVPRCVSAPPEKFYEKDQSDAGSVRRYRLDDPDEHLNEKDTSRLQPSTIETRSTKSTATKKKWTCF